MFILKSAELIPQQINFVNPLFTYFFIYFFKMFYIFLKKALTQRLKCAIIPKSEAVPQNKNLGVAQLVARYLGVVEAASSSLVTQTKHFCQGAQKNELSRKISARFLFVLTFSIHLYHS